MLTRDQLMAAGSRLDFVDVDCTKEAGGVVRIGVMTGAERSRFDGECASHRTADSVDEQHVRAVLICLTATGEDGKRLLTLDDVPMVIGWQAPLQRKLFDAAWKLNLLGVTGEEEAEKN